jgi:iron complex transport system substrate-binding protein
LNICSLIPSATEILFGIGLGHAVVGVSHECDYPEEATLKAKITKNRLDNNLGSREIDREVTRRIQLGESLYELDMESLRKANPDIIFTQQLCNVCAVSYAEVYRASKLLPKTPKIVTLEPTSLDDIISDVLRVGEVTGATEGARILAENLRVKRERVRRKVSRLEKKNFPKVACLEWLDPPYCAGHWIPEMVEIVGGRDEIGVRHKPSIKVPWKRIVEYSPEIMVLMPCGFDLLRTMKEARLLRNLDEYKRIPAIINGRVYATDANSYFSRSGPRLFDSLEFLLEIIHPNLSEVTGSKNEQCYRRVEITGS